MTLHPQHIGWSNRLQMLDEFLAELREYPSLWNRPQGNARVTGWKPTPPTRICAANRASGRTMPAVSDEGAGERCSGLRPANFFRERSKGALIGAENGAEGFSC